MFYLEHARYRGEMNHAREFKTITVHHQGVPGGVEGDFQPPDHAGDSPPPEHEDAPSLELGLAGLAFSGGGVRSATFGLGVVQALAKHKILR
jgi:predicted acylesterase/phospholipase RssA